MAVQTESQTTTVDVADGLKGDSNGVRPKIIRALDDEGGTTDAKVCRPLQLPSHITTYINRR
jgi:DNA-binding transcriptional ArsR family regulator